MFSNNPGVRRAQRHSAQVEATLDPHELRLFFLVDARRAGRANGTSRVAGSGA